MRSACLILVMLLAPIATGAQSTVSFPTQDGGTIFADLYGSGVRTVVLAHGGQFNKESWTPQARILTAHGFRVLAIDFRGYGKSHGPVDSHPMDAPLDLDVLGAVRYLHETGARSVSIVGASMGGTAAGDAAIESPPGEIDRVVMMGAAPSRPARQLHSATLFLIARNDADDNVPRLPSIQLQYNQAPQPKRLVILPGSAHAQHLFETPQGQRVMNEILKFLARR